MKKIFALLIVAAAGIGGFLWWKRNQVITANEMSADPWPVAVAEVEVPIVETPIVEAKAEVAPPAESSTIEKVTPKKAKSKKTDKESTESGDAKD
jgi:cytoskeletal protein RodZ